MSNAVKVTHIITALDIGGAERMLTNLIMNKHNSSQFIHSVIVITKIGVMATNLRRHGINVKCLGMNNFLNSPYIIFKLIKEIKEQRPNIIHTWMYHSDLIGGIAARIAGIKNVIWSIRNTDIYSGYGLSKSTFWIMKICSVLSRIVPTKIVCVSETALQSHIKFGYNQEKCVKIENGFDTNFFLMDPKSRKILRAKWKINNEKYIIGSIARFNNYKDHLTFINAAEHIIEKKYNVSFLLVGKGIINNPYLLKILSSKRLRKYFILLGPKKNIPSILSAIDIFCLHSKSEGFPNALGEAMSMSIPSVATDVGDSKILLNNNRCIVPKEDSKKLANKIIELLNYSKKKRNEIGKRARNQVLKNYSIGKIYKKYTNLYLEILNHEK